MYILTNAIKSITRNKARNILIAIIALVIAISACIALSIRQAAETAKEDTLAGMSVTAQISFDRSSMMSDMRDQMKPPTGEGGTGGNRQPGERPNFDFEALRGESLTLEDYLTYTKAQDEGDSYYYSLATSLNASGDILPYGEEEGESAESTDNGSGIQSMDGQTIAGKAPGGMGGKGGMGKNSFSAQGDFSLTGYSSYEAMLSMFGEDGSHSVSDGQMFEADSDTLECVISDELAIYNELGVGDALTLANPNYEEETYTLTVVGIYTNSASDQGNSKFSFFDPANNIYMSYDALKAIVDRSTELGHKATDDNGEETEAALAGELDFTYVFVNADHYYAFEKAVTELGLSENYTVSSSDLAAFENSLIPLNTLSTMAGWFFLIVLMIGGVILVVINIFNLRERKYEVGVLTAIGMKKRKVALQFVCELLIITFAAIVVGAVSGAAVSVPVTNALLQNQIESAENANNNLNDRFGFGGDKGGQMGEGGGRGQQFGNRGEGMINMMNPNASYIESVSSATNLVVILELIGVGLFLTIVSSLAAMVTIMRYEPLKILSNRT